MAIQNKITVISGATGGLGRVVAREFAEQGAKLVLVGTNAERLAQLVAELKLNPESYVTVVADLTQSGAAQVVLEAALAKFGRVDILFNFIGGWIAASRYQQCHAKRSKTCWRSTFGRASTLLKLSSRTCSKTTGGAM